MASTDGNWEVYANWGEYVYLMEERERYKEERRAIERERQLMREQMGDWFTPEYERFEGYLRSDESTVAFLVRGSRRCPWAKGKWLDVTDIEFGWRDTSHARGVQHYWAYDGCEDEPMGGDNETVEIQRAVIELFPQTAIPRHIPGMGMVNLFNTWRVGSRDIEKARKSGCRGQRWSVRLELVDSTQDQCEERVLKPHWSERDGMWVDALGVLCGSYPREVHMLEGPDPVWRHRVVAAERI